MSSGSPQESYRSLRFVADGTTTTYTIPFSYLSPDDITVTINGEPTGDYWLPSQGQLTFNSPPPKGKVVVIARSTPTTRLVDFTNTSMLNAGILDLDSNQLMYLIQEALDSVKSLLGLSFDDTDSFDARGYRIKNLGDPIGPKDAVTKDFADAILDQAEALVALAREAERNAKAHEVSAGEHASEAKAQADRAESEADRAKHEADNAKYEADNARDVLNQALLSIEEAERALAEIRRVIDDFSFIVDGGTFITNFDGGRFVRGDEIVLSGGIFVRGDELILNAGTFDPLEGVIPNSTNY